MFKAELKSETLKSLVYVVSTLVDEVKFSIHPDSLSMKAIDPAHIAMIDVSVDKDAFISYEADECEIGMDLDKLKSVLKLAGPGDVIVMEHDPNQGRLSLTIGNIVRRMSLVDSNGMSDPKVPSFDLSTKVDIQIEQLKKGISATETISDHIKLEADPEGFCLSCEEDMDFASLRVPASELVGLTATARVSSMYPLENFSNFVKVIPTGTVLNIQLDTDYPVKLMFSLADGHARVVYYLAPRIESE